MSEDKEENEPFFKALQYAESKCPTVSLEQERLYHAFIDGMKEQAKSDESIIQQTLLYVAENAEIRYVFDEPVVYKKGILNMAPEIIKLIK